MNTKICRHCKEDKPLEEFGNDKHSKDGKRSYCLICARTKTSSSHAKFRDKRKEYVKQWRIDNKEKMNKRANLYRKKRRLEFKQKFLDILGGKCIVCNYDACIASLDFHHLDADSKELSIGHALSTHSNKVFDLIEEEIKRCVVLCCRCHRELHYGFITLP